MIALSGPGSQKGPLLAALERNGAQLPLDAQRAVNPNHHLPVEDGVEWITCYAESLEPVEKALARHKKWRLRMHYTKQSAPQARDELAELKERIAALEARL